MRPLALHICLLVTVLRSIKGFHRGHHQTAAAFGYSWPEADRIILGKYSAVHYWSPEPASCPQGGFFIRLNRLVRQGAAPNGPKGLWKYYTHISSLCKYPFKSLHGGGPSQTHTSTQILFHITVIRNGLKRKDWEWGDSYVQYFQRSQAIPTTQTRAPIF